MKERRSLSGLVLVAAMLAAAGMVQAQMANLYVGIDGRATFPGGTYAGLANPNHGRLTLLYAHHYVYGEFHRNHYHGIGSYAYSGPADNPTVNDSNAGHRIPEVYTGLPGITLLPDAAPVWAGRLISKKHEEHYSDFRLRSVHNLASFGVGSSEHYMFHSSGGTRTDPLTDATLALELVSISPGLNLADAEGNPILEQIGERQVIGEGNDPDFEYLPVFWVDAAAEPGTYSAEFRLVDVNEAEGRTPFPSSGRFSFDFRVPEPMALEIATTVTLTMPLVVQGYVLEAAPSADGPWTEVPTPAAEDTRHSQTRTTRELTMPLTEAQAFYRLRQVEPAAN